MSIKIYDAWRMPAMPMAKFQRWLNELRSVLKPMADAHLLKEILTQTVRNYDLKCVFPNDVDIQKRSSTLVGAWADITAEIRDIKRTGKRNPGIDVECEIIFSFYGRYIYMVMFSEMEKYKTHMSSLPGVEDYSYWNNTDKPDDITNREWRNREQMWEKIFAGSFFFKGGLTWTLINNVDIVLPPDKKSFDISFISWDRRINEMLDELVIKEYPERLTTANLFDAYNWMRTTEEAKKIRENFLPKISSLLIKELTFEDLNKK